MFSHQCSIKALVLSTHHITSHLPSHYIPTSTSTSTSTLITSITSTTTTITTTNNTGKYYPGKITLDNRDGTFDVLYDDGEKETRVEEKMIRLLAKNTIVPVASTALVQAVSAGTTALQVNPSIYEYHMTPHILHSIQL